MINSPPKRRWLQFSLRGLLVVMTLLAVGCGVVWQFWPWWQERLLVSNLRQRVLHAKDSAEAGNAYRALLQLNNRKRIERLASDEDTSIALKASFELLADRTEVWAKLPPKQRDAFLHVLKEKAGLIPPAWWSESLLEIFPSPRNSVFGYAERMNEDQGVVLRSGGQELHFTPDQFRKIVGSGGLFKDRYALCVVPPRCYLAICCDVGWGNELHCLDSTKVNQIWKADVWSLGVHNLGGITGRWSHGQQLEMDDGRVVAWGTGTGGSYVEAFDAITGECRLRFCTEYWYTGTYQ